MLLNSVKVRGSKGHSILEDLVSANLSLLQSIPLKGILTDDVSGGVNVIKTCAPSSKAP